MTLSYEELNYTIENNSYSKTVLPIFKLAVFALCLFIWGSTGLISANAPILVVSEPIPNEKAVIKTPNIKEVLKVAIPSINVLSGTEYTKVYANGEMDTPKEFSKVGWVNLYDKTTGDSNLVLSGHYDYPSGTPAVFFNLNNIQKGDEVYIKYVVEGGKELESRYRVVSKYLAEPYNNTHVSVTFKKSQTPIITLITCNGIWNPVVHEYSHRVVVKAELVD